MRGRSRLAARYFQCWCFCWLATRILNIKIMFSTSRYVVIKRKNVKRHCHRRWEIMNDRPFKTKEVHFQARSKLLLGIITFWWLLKITFEQSFWNVWAFCQKQKTTDWQIILTNSLQVTDFQRVSFGTILSKNLNGDSTIEHYFKCWTKLRTKETFSSLLTCNENERNSFQIEH